MDVNPVNLNFLNQENRRLAIVIHPKFQSLSNEFEKAKSRFEFMNSMFKAKRSSHFFLITKALLSMPEAYFRNFSDIYADKELLSFNLLNESLIISKNCLNVYYRLLTHLENYRKAELETYNGFFADITKKTQSPEIYVQVSRLRLFNGFSCCISNQAKSEIKSLGLDKGALNQIELLS